MKQPQAAGFRFPSELRVYIDPWTGLPVNALTTSAASDSKIYQDHPQWTACGNWIVFRSNRASPDNGHQAFALHEATGTIVQLTEGPGLFAGTLNVSRLTPRLYFLRRLEAGRVGLMELDLEFLSSSDGENNKLLKPERLITYIPENLRESGGLALDADEQTAYLGACELTEAEKRGEIPPPYIPGTEIPSVPSCLLAIGLTDGNIDCVTKTPFTIGHVQTNPWVSGEIVFCHETGGYAPQRMYTMQVGSSYRPLYSQSPGEWVTHEAVVTRDEVMFAIMGHLPNLRRKPTGLAVINLRNDHMKIIGQCDVGKGFWHVNGSPDGRWAVGDDFDGNIHVIDRRNGRLTTLTSGHVMKPDHAHPTFSPDSTRILFQSGYLSGGRNLNLMTVMIGQLT